MSDLPGELIIAGIGNPYRGDDAAGWLVIDALKGKMDGVIPCCKLRGELSELLDLFASYSIVYLVDACLSNDPTSAWQRIDVHRQPLPPESSQTSTHGLGLSQAIALAKNLDQLPSTLVVYAITGSCYQVSDMLSPGIAQAVEEVAQKIINEEDIRACMKKA